MNRVESALVVCEQCGLAHRWQPIAPGRKARCTRCDAVVGRHHRLSIESVLALTLAAAAVFVVAISTDMISIGLRGASTGATLPEAISLAWRDGQPAIALVAAMTALIAPSLFIGLRLYVLFPLVAGKKPRGFAWCVRALRQAARWNMVEVFTIGVLLSLVRLANLADASPEIGLYALGALTVLFAAIESAGLKHLWWQVR